MFYILNFQLRSYILKKNLGFSFSVLYLWFLDFNEDFTMSLEENKVNDGRENQN